MSDFTFRPPSFVRWESFLINGRVRLPFVVQIFPSTAKRPGKPEVFQFPFSSTIVKLFLTHFLSCAQNFYQYLTFHFRTNDFIIVLRCLLGSWMEESFTVSYQQTDWRTSGTSWILEFRFFTLNRVSLFTCVSKINERSSRWINTKLFGI